MKKITKVIMAAVAVSTLCFASCKMADDLFGGDFIEYTSTKNSKTGAEATASIDYTNETESIERGIRLLNDNKKDIAVNVIMENSADEPGFMSVIFNKTENEDDTLNFIALGYNSKDNSGNAKIACTYYKNVSEDGYSKADFGKTGTSDCKEILANTWFKSSISPDNDGKLTVGFVITANEGSNPYTVRIYGNKTTEELNEIADAIGSTTTADDGVIGTPEKQFNITADELGLERNENSAKIDAGIGFYANVFEGKTLKGEWQVGDISHNPDGIVWAE